MVDIESVLPLLLITLPALVLLVVTSHNENVIKAISSLGCVAAVLATIVYLPAMQQVSFNGGSHTWSGLMTYDLFVGFAWITLFFGGLLISLLSAGSFSEDGVKSPREWYILLHTSLFGAGLLAASANVVTFVLGFETLSLSAACMVGAAVSSRTSAEGALKYFFAGALGSAFLLMGFALLFGLSGSLSFDDYRVLLKGADHTSLIVALVCVLIGLAYKIALVPFHLWSPDSYQGAPRSSMAFLSSVVKIAAFYAVCVVLVRGLSGVTRLSFIATGWSGALWYLIAASVLVGNIMALRQTSTRRLLAYSGVSHAGFLVTMLLSPDMIGVGAGLFYAVIYALASICFMSAVMPSLSGSDAIVKLSGLSLFSPGRAFAASISLLTLAGIPPIMCGLIAKAYVFGSLLNAEYLGLAILVGLSSAIGCAYYLKIIWTIYFSQPGEIRLPAAHVSSAAVSAICVGLLVWLSISPGTLLIMANAAAASLLK